MPKVSTYPVATTPAGIDLLGVQGGVTKKLPSSLLATQAELDAHAHTGTYVPYLNGADATGATSSTAALTAKETALGATGGAIEFPPGTFAFGDASFSPNAAIHYHGSRRGSTTIKALAASSSLVYLGGTVADFEITDMTFDGTNVTSGSPIDLYGCRRFALRRLLMKDNPGNAITLRNCEDFTLEDIEGQWSSANNSPPTLIYLINCRRGKVIRPKHSGHIYTLVLQTGCSDIEVVEPSGDGQWFVLPARFSGSGGTVTYTATSVVDTANPWAAANPAISVNSTVRAMSIRVASTTATAYEPERITKTGGTFVASGVVEGDVVVVGTVWTMVEKALDAETLAIDGWRNRSDNLPAVAPSTATNFIIYKLILGDITSVAGNTLNVVEWTDLTGTVATPANGTLYEVCYNHANHLMLADSACRRMSSTGGSLKRGWGDQINYAGDFSKISDMTVEFGFDIGIGIEGGIGSKVTGCTTRRNGSIGIWADNDSLVVGNTCVADGWNTSDTRLGMIQVVGSRCVVDGNRLLQSVLTKTTKVPIVVDAYTALDGNKIGEDNLATGFTPRLLLMFARSANITNTVVPDFKSVDSLNNVGTVTGTVVADPGFGIVDTNTTMAAVAAAGVVTQTAADGYYIRVPEGGVISKIAVYIGGVSAGNVCVGVYRNTGVGEASTPGARVASSGSVACPAINGRREIALTASVIVYEGDWLRFWASDGTMTRLGHASGFSNDMFKGKCGMLSEAADPATGGAPTWGNYRTPVLVGVA